MISNIQQQSFEMGKRLNTETPNVYVNNNNNNNNKNVIMPSHNQSLYQNYNNYDKTINHTKETLPGKEIRQNLSPKLNFNHQNEQHQQQLMQIKNDNQEYAFQKIDITDHSYINNIDNCQKNEIRRIEDVHNYSKTNRSEDSTNSSSQDEDDDDDEDEDDNDKHIVGDEEIGLSQMKTDSTEVPERRSSELLDDEEEKSAPAHYARRPMNAFLIFCKRHRAIVKEKNKQLENRAITKILGDWWAFLHETEKASYTNLAKEYKDAFFTANPNFKWYKLPAPPLRTLSTRPTNERPLIVANSNYSYTNDYDTITGINGRNNRPATLSDYYILDTESQQHDTRINSPIKSTNVSEFKLAELDQMGGLSSLMSSNNGKINVNGNLPSDNQNDNNTDKYNQNQALQQALCETSEFMSSTFTNRHTEPFQNMRDHATRMEHDSTCNGKRKYPNEINLNGSKKSFIPNDLTLSPNEDDNAFKKAVRSCKGKKYKEFMTAGQITSPAKKTKSRQGSTSSTFPHNGYCKSLDTSNESDTILSEKRTKIDSPISDIEKMLPITPDSPMKQFNASDFNLEAKIKALPAQRIEHYLQRKREAKNKKKINSKRHTTSARTSGGGHNNGLGNKQQIVPRTIQEVKEQLQVVGSQKRKARKESITRRDINAVKNDTQDAIYQSFVQIGATIQTECEEEEIKCEPAATSDLLILAEVATNQI